MRRVNTIIKFTDSKIIIQNLDGSDDVYNKKYYTYAVPNNISLLTGDVSSVRILHINDRKIAKTYPEVRTF